MYENEWGVRVENQAQAQLINCSMSANTEGGLIVGSSHDLTDTPPATETADADILNCSFVDNVTWCAGSRRRNRTQ